MTHRQRGGSFGDLYRPGVEPFTRDDGKTIYRHALRCRWCLAATTSHDRPEDSPPDDLSHFNHHRPCPVADLYDRFIAEGWSAALVDRFDALVVKLDAESER
jgi:hypothetical protein